MSADGKVYIYISEEPMGNGNGGGSSTTNITNNYNYGSKDAKDTEKSKGDKWLDHEMMHFLKSQAQQMVNYTMNNIGNFTGDYQTQKEVNNAMSMLGAITNIGVSALAGFKYGGVYGAVAGAAISTVSQGINFALSEISAEVQVRKQNYEIDRMRDISGLNGLTNGSRI